MVEHSRYNVSVEEGKEVLKNKLGITDQKMLEDTETLLLSDAYSHFFDLLSLGKLRFDLKLIFQIHKYFLSILYDWAGKIRKVEMSREGILFCASLQVRRELQEFERTFKTRIPKQGDTKNEISNKLAFIHCELNAIHPFREGNGRTIRLFLDLLAVKSGFDVIDYKKNSRKSYIEACKAGMHQDYSKMEKIIFKGLSK